MPQCSEPPCLVYHLGEDMGEFDKLGPNAVFVGGFCVRNPRQAHQVQKGFYFFRHQPLFNLGGSLAFLKLVFSDKSN